MATSRPKALDKSKNKAPKKKKMTGKMPRKMKSKVDGMPIITRPKKKDKNRKVSM